MAGGGGGAHTAPLSAPPVSGHSGAGRRSRRPRPSLRPALRGRAGLPAAAAASPCDRYGAGAGAGLGRGRLPGLGGSVGSGRAPRVCGRQGREGRAGVPRGSGGWLEGGRGRRGLHGALPERLPAGRCPGLCRACARLHLREATGLAQGCFYCLFLRRGWEGRW